MSGKKRNFERFKSRNEAVAYWSRNSKRLFPVLATVTCDGKDYFDILEWLFDYTSDAMVNESEAEK